jgi:hypothetical protein
MRRYQLGWLLGLLALVLSGSQAAALSGFYVGQADSRLFNQTSRVVLTRHDGKTVVTMVNDYQGALAEFAMVVPVPGVLERGQIHVSERAAVDHLDAYTAPRLVKRFDNDPCRTDLAGQARRDGATATVAQEGADALGVTIEAAYAVCEYDVEILSAEQSDGLAAWLRSSGYRLPAGAEDLLAEYLAAGMRFLFARVNLEEQSKLGSSYLRPLQMAFESEDFALPIRLGTLNAAGPQELVVYLLTRHGRVETANYLTKRMPSDVELPLFVEDEPGTFYGAMFEAEVARAGGRVVFLEHASDLFTCEPCVAEPLALDQLRELGVFWLLDGPPPGLLPQPRDTAAPEVFVTRLHLRNDAEHFPADLRFRETADRSGFQVRYTLRHPWPGEPRCEAARDYLQALPPRFEQEAQNLARLTRWPIAEIRTMMEANDQSFAPPNLALAERKWWERLWPDSRIASGKSTPGGT